jgi:hypothetical protein
MSPAGDLRRDDQEFPGKIKHLHSTLSGHGVQIPLTFLTVIGTIKLSRRRRSEGQGG